MSISLHNDLASPGWHTSICTTYSVDPAFYDAYMERRLRAYGCENNLLLADAGMLNRALEATPEGFAMAGSRYVVVPVSVGGAFHPKLHLRLGEKKARLVVASANATAAGWGRNLEVVATLDWSEGVADEDDYSPLIGKAFEYLKGWLQTYPGDAIRHKLDLMQRRSPWLRGVEANEHPIELDDGTAVDLLCDRGGNNPSMLQQFTSLAKASRVRRLVVVSPYWDGDLAGFKALRKALGDPETFVWLNPEEHQFPIDKLPKRDALNFLRAPKDRFIHAKLLIAETKDGDHVLAGSPNCSDDALGGLSEGSRNAEVAIYRRLAPNTVLQKLKIDLDKVLSRDQLADPLNREPPRSDKKGAPAGVIELTPSGVSWWPPAGIDPQGATIKIGSESVSPKPVTSVRWAAAFVEPGRYPVVARVHYKSGRIGGPVLVHAPLRLQKHAPGVMDPRINDAINRINSGEGDLLDLAQQANSIFASDKPSRARPILGGRQRRVREQLGQGQQFDSAEEFARALAAKQANGNSGRIVEGDQSLQGICAIALRGIMAALENPDEEPETNDDDLIAGDDEDEPASMVDSTESAVATPTPRPAAKPGVSTGPYTAEQVDSRRKRLVRVLDKFDEMLKGLRREPTTVSTRLLLQTLFVIGLLRYGCAFEHRGAPAGWTRLVRVASDFGRERKYTFAVRAVWMLMELWVGSNPPVAGMGIEPSEEGMADDVFAFVVASRWAIARSYLSTREESETHATHILRVAPGLFRSTMRFGPVDANAEAETMRLLDEGVGAGQDDSEELVEWCRQLSEHLLLNEGNLHADARA